ncbi:Outer membrane protein OmpA [Xylanibacter ruminicola]|uniref:Outer membrane protein OmpA n=2 Tax=Xylanibacter ruminicola TaxID=839 RepID=A0A1M7LTU2_XYLRU|nr:Outer membrane protein OmpA [Xylanibacter ruminicola]SHM81638.1 Outer membrane protein OmpA [Xylanibacter ruminicola]
MKMKKTILSCLMLLAGISANAQEQKGTTEYVFEPHWYVQIQPLGAQYTLGEVSFGDLLSYNVQATVGRQFSKLWGARLAVNAWQSKAGSKFDIANKEYKWKWNYVAPTIDATFNLSNALFGFNPNRVFDLSAFAGIGVNIGWGNSEAATADQAIRAMGTLVGANGTTYTTNRGLEYLWDGTKVRLVGQFGLMGDFKVSDKVKIGLELSANTLNDKYNSKKAKNWDWYFNALAGVKIALGNTYSTRFIPAPEPEIRYVEKIVEKVVEVPAKAEEPEAKTEALRRDIFFAIGKTVIRKSEQQKVDEVVAYLNANPEAKVNITGYADAGTGNDRINDRLAAGRADVVVKALKKAGIAASRISYDSKGARVQPFADNDSNRVSIVIAE